MTDCVSLCQPEFVYVRPRRPVRLRCCLCQTQERGAAGNAELVHTLVLLVVLWCTLLVHSGAHYWCTLEHRALDSTGALRSVGAACAAGGSFPRSVALPPPDRRYLPHRERKCNFWAKMKIQKVQSYKCIRILLHKIKHTQLQCSFHLI